jgi:hypothetical protein
LLCSTAATRQIVSQGQGVAGVEIVRALLLCSAPGDISVAKR